MSIPYYVVDAFVGNGFKGNPAGVCVLDHWLPDDTMQSIAAENNLSETAFFVPSGKMFELRWFTPTVEVDLCGHATLATAHVIFQYVNRTLQRIEFSTKSSLLAVSRDGEFLSMDFPARPPVLMESSSDINQGLGRAPREVHGARDLLCVFDSEEEVRSLAPNIDILSRIECTGVIATAPGEGADFVSRFFAPRAGIAEDPVTGSSHCTLVPYWSLRLGKDKLHALQISSRGGELFCENRGARVNLQGKARVYLEGAINP